MEEETVIVSLDFINFMFLYWNYCVLFFFFVEGGGKSQLLKY
jgi:hypothetical protein